MSLARTALQQLRVSAGHIHASARQTAGASPLLPFGAARTAVTRRTMSTASRSSTSTASSAARWTAIAAVGGSLALGLGVAQTRSVYLEEVQGDKAGSEKKKAKKESKKEGVSDSESKGESGKPKKSAERGEKAVKSSKESGKTEDDAPDAGQGKGSQKTEEEVREASSLDMDNLSDEASQQSAFDPETNTINWDCSCLGGMADGPCGEQFKEAFSCFVFSEADPKGVDCIENFKTMQDCFRKYPEHYKEELEDEEEAGAGESADDKKAGGGETDSNQVGTDGEEDDEGLREWRAEMAKEK